MVMMWPGDVPFLRSCVSRRSVTVWQLAPLPRHSRHLSSRAADPSIISQPTGCNNISVKLACSHPRILVREHPKESYLPSPHRLVSTGLFENVIVKSFKVGCQCEAVSSPKHWVIMTWWLNVCKLLKSMLKESLTKTNWPLISLQIQTLPWGRRVST